MREVLGRPDVFSSAGALRPDQVPGQEAIAELAKGFQQTRTVLTTDGEAHQRYPAAIEEGARFDAPVQGFRRTVTAPFTLAGHELKEGDQVFVSYGSAGRDEAVFERADTFDITRDPVRHLSFGHGVHGCPGAQLAREQVRLTLERLAGRLPGLRLASGRVTMEPTLIHRSPEALHITW